jgi:hypothetical protein
MEISNANKIVNNNTNNFLVNDENSSDQTKTNSTDDNFSTETNLNKNNIENTNNSEAKRDLSKLIQLINREKKALSETQINNNSTLFKKPTFNEIKNNVQIIQHNIDNFFNIPGKKISLKKNKKEEDL